MIWKWASRGALGAFIVAFILMWICFVMASPWDEDTLGLVRVSVTIIGLVTASGAALGGLAGGLRWMNLNRLRRPQGRTQQR